VLRHSAARVGHARSLLITLLAKVSDALRCLDALVQV